MEALRKRDRRGGVHSCKPKPLHPSGSGCLESLSALARGASQVAPTGQHNLHVCAFLPPALPVSFLIVPGQSSAASFSSPPLPSHFPKDFISPRCSVSSVPTAHWRSQVSSTVCPRHLSASSEFPVPLNLLSFCCQGWSRSVLSMVQFLLSIKLHSFLKSRHLGISLLWLLWACPGSIEHLLWASVCCVQFYKRWPVVL